MTGVKSAGSHHRWGRSIQTAHGQPQSRLVAIPSFQPKARQASGASGARERDLAERLVSSAELRDSATGAHMRRVGRLTVLLARSLGVPDDVLPHLELAATMHDIGKIGIPDQVLNKPGLLDAGERRIMEQHTLMGARLLGQSRARAVQLGREIALNHHERWDGTGYPYGISGSAIPLLARIVAVVDYFDATVTDRPYRAAMKPCDAFAMMRVGRRKRFDPEILDRFLALQPQTM